MEILKCEGIKKVYGSGANQVKALDGIDLVVDKGEFVAIIGAKIYLCPFCWIKRNQIRNFLTK